MRRRGGVVVDLDEQRELVVHREDAAPHRSRRQRRLELLIGTNRRHARGGYRCQDEAAHGERPLREIRHVEVVQHRADLVGGQIVRRDAKLISPGRNLEPAERAHPRPLNDCFCLGTQIEGHRVGVAALVLALGIHREIRDLDLVASPKPQILPAHFHAEQDGGVRRRALERRREHLHGQAADRQRALERVARVHGEPARRIHGGRRCEGLRGWIRVASSRAHGEPRSVHTHLNVVELAVGFWIRRVVREDVVRAVLLDDAIEGIGEAVRVDDRETARFLGKRPEAVVLQAELVLQATKTETGDLLFGQCAGGLAGAGISRATRRRGIQLDPDVAHVCQAARIDGINADVRFGRRANQIARSVDDHRGVNLVEHVFDVVLDPLAHEQQRLLAAPDAAEPVGDRLQFLERVARIEAALALHRVGDAGARHANRREILLIRLDRRRPLRLPCEFVDGGKQQALAAGEFLRVVGPALDVNHGHQVVGAQLVLDELAHRTADQLGVQRLHVQIVQHRHVDAAVERPRVGPDVRLDRLCGEERPFGAIDGNVNQREAADRLRLAVLEDLEILLLQVADEAPLLVGDDRVDLDVVHLQLEGRRFEALRRCRRLPRGRHGCSQQDDDSRDSYASVHGKLSSAPVT